MQIAASSPKFIRKSHVSPALWEQEAEKFRLDAIATGKPKQLIAKMVEGKIAKYYEEVCLYEQPFLKDRSTSIAYDLPPKISSI